MLQLFYSELVILPHILLLLPIKWAVLLIICVVEVRCGVGVLVAVTDQILLAAEGVCARRALLAFPVAVLVMGAAEVAPQVGRLLGDERPAVAT